MHAATGLQNIFTTANLIVIAIVIGGGFYNLSVGNRPMSMRSHHSSLRAKNSLSLFNLDLSIA